MTLKDIADALGVSYATVSLALSGSPKVKAETRGRIVAYAEKVGYRPNMMARNLRGGGSRTVGVLFPFFTNAFYSELTGEIQRNLEAHGYFGMFHTVGGGDNLPGIVDGLIGRRVEGVIACSFELRKLLPLHNAEIPVVIYRNIDGLPFSSVDVDRVRGGEMAGRYFVERNRKKIAYVGSINGGREARFLGFKSALAQGGIDLIDERIIETDSSMTGGLEGMRRLLESGVETDAVFCFNDTTAIGVRRAIFESGLSVPDEISIIGFDDIDDAKFMTPALTTIRQPKSMIAESLVELTLSAIQNGGKELRNVILEPELIIRET